MGSRGGASCDLRECQMSVSLSPSRKKAVETYKEGFACSSDEQEGSRSRGPGEAGGVCGCF